MIIRPKNEIPIPEAYGQEQDLWIFPVYQTRADYASDHGGKEPPPPDPAMRCKHWYDPLYAGISEDNGEVAVYDVVHRHPITDQLVLDALGRPRITKLLLPVHIAGRVNIPEGTANEFPADATISRLRPYPVPIRMLHNDEEIRSSSSPFNPNITVVNVRIAARESEQKEGFDAQDRLRLKVIESKLDAILMVLGSPLKEVKEENSHT